jgi:ABC-type Fe3+ transport system permease subunit
VKGSTDKGLTQTWLATLIATLAVVVLFWCINHSFVLNVDESEADFRAGLSLFERLDWLWKILFLVPGLLIGAAGIRFPILCGVVAYVTGCEVLWLCDGGLSGLSSPILRPDFWPALGRTFLGAGTHGLVLSALGWLGRYIVLRLINRRRRV